MQTKDRILLVEKSHANRNIIDYFQFKDGILAVMIVYFPCDPWRHQNLCRYGLWKISRRELYSTAFILYQIEHQGIENQRVDKIWVYWKMWNCFRDVFPFRIHVISVILLVFLGRWHTVRRPYCMNEMYIFIHLLVMEFQ